jgi:hypothetical protein
MSVDSVSGLYSNMTFPLTPFSVLVGLIPLHLWRGCILIGVPSRLHQLPYLLHRGEFDLVLFKPIMEGPERMLLVSGFRMVTLKTPSHQRRNSCFNAFSRVDICVDVKIPGGVNPYVIDLRGERCVHRHFSFKCTFFKKLCF